ncbi:MAG: antibiotic biosynthesis monooxygenase [Chloroflexota bacterium]|nr:antibiotic biosynthesis monooxygenase [Chloroflexota bacterium]
MDTERFDHLAKTFATKFSRRSALRTGGAGLAATLLATVGGHAVGARQAGSTWYTVIRQYALSGSSDAVLQELNSGFLPLIRQEPGYVQYLVVASADNTVTTITVFESQAQLEAAAQSEADWVQQNLASLLPAPAEVTSGDAIIDDVNTDLVCGSGPAPTTEPIEPTVPATEAPCTGIGCACNGGVQNACDEGLVCCQSQMGGGSTPGGAGMCAAADACGDDATPVS